MEGSVLDLKLFIVLQQEQFIECTDKEQWAVLLFRFWKICWSQTECLRDVT